MWRFFGRRFCWFLHNCDTFEKIKKFEQKTGLSVLDAILINVFFEYHFIPSERTRAALLVIFPRARHFLGSFSRFFFEKRNNVLSFSFLFYLIELGLKKDQSENRLQSSLTVRLWQNRGRNSPHNTLTEKIFHDYRIFQSIKNLLTLTREQTSKIFNLKFDLLTNFVLCQK